MKDFVETFTKGFKAGQMSAFRQIKRTLEGPFADTAIEIIDSILNEENGSTVEQDQGETQANV